MKKPRKKKYNRKDSLNRMYTTLCENAIGRFAIIGSSVTTPNVIAMSQTAITATQNALSVVAEVVIGELLESPKTWYGWVMFAYQLGDEVAIEAFTAQIPDANLSDFTDNIDKMVLDLNPMENEPTGFAFWFSPTNAYMLEESSDNLTDYWMRLGVDLPEKQLKPEDRKLTLRGVENAILRRYISPVKVDRVTDTVAVAKE